MDFLIIDPTTVILSVAVILLSAAGAMANPFFRSVGPATPPDAPGETEDGGGTAPRTPLPQATVLITVHDQADSLGRNLPAFLSQDYPDYRVVVVGEKGDGETEDILKRLAARHSRLYYTLIPESSRYMSRKKLQVTLGVKAAGSEWIVLTEATMRPQSDRWLATMATHFANDCNLVMGYAGFDDATPGYRRFIRLREACYLLRRARRGRALSTNMANLAFRKSDFLRHNGFRGNLQLVRGEYEFLVNRYAERGRTRVVLSPAAWLTEEAPGNRTWLNTYLYHIAALPLLSHTGSMRLLRFADHLLPHLSLAAGLAAVAWGLLAHNALPLASGVLALLVLAVARTLIAARAMRRFGIAIPAPLLPFYEWSVVAHNALMHLHYWRADKNDFTSHKL